MHSRECAQKQMDSPKYNWKNTIQMVLTGVALASLGAVAYLTYASGIQSKPQEPQSLARDHAHAVIAITCPCAPFFGFGEKEGSELGMISAAFGLMGQHAQYVYLSYEEAVGHMEKHHVQGILAFSSIHRPGNSDHLSEPLVTRDFVVVALAANQETIGEREDLAKLKVGIHPDILEVLEPQLKEAFKDTGTLQKVSNYVLLSSMLFTGEIDALITEKFIFTHSLGSVPSDAQPSQQVKFYRLFDPVYPKISFANKTLRDRFNDAWEEIVKTEPNRK